MALKKFRLIEKIKLNQNIYELTFELNEEFSFEYGQFITFILPKIGWRAYSILKTQGNKLTFIIKKREKEDWWRWWSLYICEREVWDVLNWVWPAGHFVLQKNNKNKLFIWTGTGLVPLYNQVIWILKENYDCNLKIIFWVRCNKDLFYIDKLLELKKENSNFDFEIYLSKEEIEWYNKWYIIDYLTQENLENFEEFYICGIPKMIDSAKEILENNWVEKENVFSEKY